MENKISNNSIMQTLLHNTIAMAALIIVIVVILSCIFAPMLTSYDYMDINLENKLSYPSRSHLLGTDSLGRDQFTRMLYGGRVTLRITFVAALISILGIPMGMLSGYFGGMIDTVISRFFDAISSLPPLILIVLAEYVFGYGQGNYQYALGLAFMPPIYRLTRTTTLNVVDKEYIEASKALGVKPGSILINHVLRNIAPELLTQIVGSISDILLYCTICGYLEIGVNPPTPEWGMIIHTCFTVILAKPFLVVISSSVITIFVLAINLFGRGLRDAFAADRRVN